MKKAEDAILKFMQERRWDKSVPANVAKSISIEAAELLELFQWSHESMEELSKDAEKLERVKEELGDIFIYAFIIPILLKLDTEQLVLDKLAKVAEKYPVELMKGKGGLEMYLKIKKDHRRKK